MWVSSRPYLPSHPYFRSGLAYELIVFGLISTTLKSLLIWHAKLSTQQSSLAYTWQFVERHPTFRTDILLLGKVHFHSDAVLWINTDYTSDKAFASAFSQIFIALTIKRFGAVVFIIIMTTRSIPQVVVSWLYFGHEFGVLGWLGVLVVFVVIGESYTQILTVSLPCP